MDDFNNKTYVKRRKEISKLMESNSCFLINSANLKFRNNDSSYFFRQDSNFYYLSGFVEPDSLIMIENNGKSTLFCRERNLELEEILGQIITVKFFLEDWRKKTEEKIRKT